MRSKAQNKLTAVGRVAARHRRAFSMWAVNCSERRNVRSFAARASPKAAAHPMAGAPRMDMSRMARATSLWVRQAM